MQLDYQAIRQRILIADVLALIDYQPSVAQASQWRGPCPLCHAESANGHRCFSVNTQRQIFRCFKCHAAGNTIELWAKLSRLPLYQATIDLCARLNIAPVELKKLQPRNRR